MDHIIFRAYFLFLIVAGSCFAEQETIRGFLYCDETGQWLLANQPNLKSCCLPKIEDKIYLEGIFDTRDIGHVLTIQGNLTTRDDLPFLLDGTIIHEGQKKWPLLLLILGVGFFFTQLTRRLLHTPRQVPD